jgi:stage V sporulation protein D (sporulation-specific penicillin-binding protein)
MRLRFVVRVRIVFAFILLFASALLVRLYVIQVVQGDAYVRQAEGQYVRPNHILFERGDIFLQDKEGRLIGGATVRAGHFLAINPMQIRDPERVYQDLSRHIELDRDDFIRRASLVDDPYEEISHQVSPETAAAITELGIPGVRMYRERWRYYPGGSLASHTLGFIAYGPDGVEREGRYGLERYYNDVLRRDEQNITINFFAELFSNISDTVRAEGRARNGAIVTSIEPSVQLFLERELAELSARWDSKGSGAIIIDPMDGRIYALAIDPPFDINEFTAADPALFRNPLVQNVYEMGSIIKPLTVAIGLDTKAVRATTEYYDAGVYVADGYRISNYDGRGRGTVDMQTALNNSLNTGMAFIVEQVGKDTFGKRLLSFGIGTETGIDLPGEVPGMVENLKSPRMVEYATASFGQGIALTPVATVRALSALANGGYLITPHIVQEIRYESGKTHTVAFPQGEQVITKDTSEEITRMLVNTVDDALRGGAFKNDRYAIAAKTGTAQMAREDARGYYDDRYLHTFFGYFPAYEPRFLVFYYTLEPKRNIRYASETLTEPFMNTVNYLINYYDIPPDR